MTSPALCFQGPADRLNFTEYTQPALLVASIAALRNVGAGRYQTMAVAGHSLGEYSALGGGRWVDVREAVWLVQKRGRYMAEAVPSGTGLVAAILGASRGSRERSVPGSVDGRYRGAGEFQFPWTDCDCRRESGRRTGDRIDESKGCRKAIPLPVSVPVHTPLMQSGGGSVGQRRRSGDMVGCDGAAGE